MVDEWSGLADMLANLIEKYASDLDIETYRNLQCAKFAHYLL